MQFLDLHLSKNTLKAIETVGYTAPTPIQAQVIPHVLQGMDVFGCAQTGTGKTASYTLPILDLLNAGRRRARMPRALILVPTRELALQVKESFETYGQFHKVKMAVIIGGESMMKQEKQLDQGVDILIATPGRLLDIFDRGKILLNDAKILVIDEADRMLDMGFIPEVEKIISFLPSSHQTLLFSATVPQPIRQLSRTFLKDPIEVSITPEQRASQNIEQFKIYVDAKKKTNLLRDLLKIQEVSKAIIFCNRKKDVSTLCSTLKRLNYKAVALHGDLTQSHRTETLNQFKSEDKILLIASDIASRGIDIDDMPCVFNFDIPINPEEYVHRIGRTGRAGQAGKAFTLVASAEEKLLKAVEKFIKQPIPVYEGPFPIAEEPKNKKALKREKPQETSSQRPPEKARRETRSFKESREPVLGFGTDVPAFFNIEIPCLKNISD